MNNLINEIFLDEMIAYCKIIDIHENYDVNI